MIRVHEVHKRFGGTKALDSATLDIRDGELFGLLGPNGAGKSTLINAIVGLVKPDSGTIERDGRPIGTREDKRTLGLVPQDLAFYPALDAASNVSFFGSLYGLKGATLRQAVEAALEFAGLSDVGKKSAKDFSGGMKRRLNIACGVVHDPDLVVFDEPTVGIDPQSRDHVLRSVESLAKRGKTVIYVTHYMEEAEAICRDIAIMDKGKVIARGSPESLKLLVKDRTSVCFKLKRSAAVDAEAFKRLPGVVEAELDELALRVTGDVAATSVSDVMAEALRQALPIAEVATDSPSLETVFLTLTGRSLRD
jgi:ABC-2 type transport system ATP-binding protein